MYSTWVFFKHRSHFLKRNDDFCTDPNMMTMKSNWKFWKKVVYSFLFRIEIQDENIFIFRCFFNIEGLFLRSRHLWNGGGKFHPQKWQRECRAGISKLSRHMQLMTLCNMSEMPDGDEPSNLPVNYQSRIGGVVIYWLFTGKIFHMISSCYFLAEFFFNYCFLHCIRHIVLLVYKFVTY